MLHVVLPELARLCQARQQMEGRTEHHLNDSSDFNRLQKFRGIDPIPAPTVLAEADNLRRSRYHSQFFQFCGLDLST